MKWPGRPGSSSGLQELCLDAGLDFVFHMFFLVKYSKSLEEGSFRGRSADFLWMLLFGECFPARLDSASSLQCNCLQNCYCGPQRPGTYSFLFMPLWALPTSASCVHLHWGPVFRS